MKPTSHDTAKKGPADGALLRPLRSLHARQMSLLPISRGDKVRWNGKSVSVVAVNPESAAVTGDGVTRIVNLKALYACQPRAPRPKSGIVA